ncbi:MAG: hypothetical protein Q7R57_07495 [Dehalococcoidales bacterium]|nr:hypothetical protein [Dehalococcoidales bacterium]
MAGFFVFMSFIDYLITKLAKIDEASIGPILKERFYPKMEHWLSVTPGVLESMQVWVEHHRGHQSTVSITEDKEKYIVTLNPCGSGGRLRLNNKVETVKKAYPWTWGKAGVPVYCTHCSVSWEICATEIRGYPIKVAHVGATPNDPCIHYFYKKPESIPEEYFTRIGKKKPAK